MSKNLVIVESPAKAKTIEKFLGSDFHVLSSQGHIRDIEPIGKNSMGIDFEHGYQPNYVIDSNKQHLVEQLQKEVGKSETVWLASDEDREGEAIAWHLQEVLDLGKKDTKRIVFHEITKPAIQEAILHPRGIDYNLVNAQQARRVLDRIVGFELSPVLWRKVTTGLSAGRVQSVAVRLIVEKEREIEAFRASSQYRIMADFIGVNPGDASVLRCELNHRFSHKKDAQAFLESLRTARFFVVDVQRKPTKHMPAPPFTTSTLQQEAARKLKFTVSKTMRVAQALYESGRITYMRTDSVNLSSLALATCKEVIASQYGDKYVHPRQFHTSSKGAQEAHEAIRPTYMSVLNAGTNRDEQRLYELIWKRTIASQMAEAETERTQVEVSITGTPFRFIATGEVTVFDGFTRVYVQSTDEAEDEHHVLPAMSLREQLRLQEAQAVQTFNKPPFRFNEATLVKRMEELGIGRPSTYATIIETIQKVKYVERGSIAGTKREATTLYLHSGEITERKRQEMYGAETQRLLPTDLGFITNDFLVENFPEILSYDFTAQEEQQFDQIAIGKADWVETVDAFYRKFHPLIDSIPSGKIESRFIGNDPETGLPVYAKISKIGPCVQMGDAAQDKPRFASLQKGQSVFTITLKEALDLFRDALPYTLGEHEGKEIIVGEGKYGPYMRYAGVFISIPRGIDPLSITMDQALELIADKQQSNEPIHQWGDIKVLKGRYGAYIQTPNGNYRLPKSVNAAALTEAEVREIIAKSEPMKPSKRPSGKKSAK